MKKRTSAFKVKLIESFSCDDSQVQLSRSSSEIAHLVFFFFFNHEDTTKENAHIQYICVNLVTKAAKLKRYEQIN